MYIYEIVFEDTLYVCTRKSARRERRPRPARLFVKVP